MSWFDKNIRFQDRLPSGMAEEMFMFAVTTGIFAFLAAVLFGSRARSTDKNMHQPRVILSTVDHTSVLSGRFYYCDYYFLILGLKISSSRKPELSSFTFFLA